MGYDQVARDGLGRGLCEAVVVGGWCPDDVFPRLAVEAPAEAA